MTKQVCQVLLCGLVACGATEQAGPEPGQTSTTDGAELGLAGTGNGNDQSSTESDGGTGGSASGVGGTTNSDTDISASGGSAGTGASDAGAGGQANVTEACPKPAGTDIDASTYEPPASVQGCRFDEPDFESVTLESENDFLARFGCPEGAASGIDFGVRRLRVTVIREAGFSLPSRRHAVLEQGTVRLGFELPVYCGGAFPPTVVVLTLLPGGAQPVADEVCKRGDCGAGGFPP